CRCDSNCLTHEDICWTCGSLDISAALARRSLLCSNFPYLSAWKASSLSCSTVATCWISDCCGAEGVGVEASGVVTAAGGAAASIAPLRINPADQRQTSLCIDFTLTLRRHLKP